MIALQTVFSEVRCSNLERTTRCVHPLKKMLLYYFTWQREQTHPFEALQAIHCHLPVSLEVIWTEPLALKQHH
jgi:hypothetical protein